MVQEYNRNIKCIVSIFVVIVQCFVQCTLTAEKLKYTCQKMAYQEFSDSHSWTGIIKFDIITNNSEIRIDIFLKESFQNVTTKPGSVFTNDNKHYEVKLNGSNLNPNNTLYLHIPYVHEQMKSKYTTSVVKSIYIDGSKICTNLRHSKRIIRSSENLPNYLKLLESRGMYSHKNYSEQNNGDIPNYLKILQGRSNSTFLNESSPSVRNCGVVQHQVQTRITYGEEVQEAEWPWHTAIYVDVVLVCGGTLVSNRHVVTAAHCITIPESNTPYGNNMIDIYLGKSRSDVLDETDSRRFSVNKIHIHPQYNWQKINNDIALIKLSDDIKYTIHIRPICLWNGDNELSNIINKQGTVVGWGYDETLKRSKILKKTKLSIVTLDTCKNSHRDYRQYVTDKMYCAGFRNGTATCSGDSGGGMYFQRDDTDPQIWQLRGIISFSRDSNRCEGRFYTVFVDVTKYQKWLRNEMEK